MIVFHRPGQQFKKFNILKAGTHKDAKGRVSNSADPQAAGAFQATLADASQQEKERYDRMNHPITHQIIQEGTSTAVAGDFLSLTEKPDRRFYIQGIDNPGELGLWTIYSVQERPGVG